MLGPVAGAVAGKVGRLKQAIRHLMIGWGRNETPPVVAITIPSQSDPHPQSPIHSLFTSRDHIMSPVLHPIRQHHVGNEVGNEAEIRNQFSVLKMRLLALRAYTADDAQQIKNDPRLDLNSLPLLSEQLVSKYIKRYNDMVHTIDVSDTYHQLLIFLVIGDYIELSTSPPKLVKILKDHNAFENLDEFCVTSAVERYVELCSEYCPSSSEVSKNKLLQMLVMERDSEAFQFYLVGILRTMLNVREHELSAVEDAKGTCERRTRELMFA